MSRSSSIGQSPFEGLAKSSADSGNDSLQSPREHSEPRVTFSPPVKKRLGQACTHVHPPFERFKF